MKKHCVPQKYTKKETALLCLGGLGAGLCGGFLGTGGGIVLILLLSHLAKKGVFGEESDVQKDVFATTILCILPMSAVSAVIYFQNGSIDLVSSVPYFLGGAVGGALGALLLSKLKIRTVKIIFALIVIYSGISMILGGARQ